MSNSQKGEFTAVLGGKHYRFRVGTEAMVELQEYLSPPKGDPISVPDIMRGVMGGRLKYVRAFLWAGLREYHPDITIKTLTGLLDESDEKEIASLLQKLGLSTMPDEKDLKELGVDGKNPRKARAKKTTGTGERSTSQPAATV